MFAIFNSLTIPLTLSFDQIDKDLRELWLYIAVDTVGTAFFVIDIFLNMNTSYYDSDGEEVFSKRRIRRNYLLGLFPIDFLSSIPFDSLCPPLPTSFKIINILKIVRIRRIAIIINKTNADEVTKSLYRILNLLFQLILVLHMVGSFWHFICSENQFWIPPLDFVYAA